MLAQEEKPVNFINYLQIFFRRKWLVIIPLVAGLYLGIIAGFILPKTYESSTVILVEEEKTINPLISGLAVSTSFIDRLRSIKEQLLGWNSLVKLTQKLNLAENINSQAAFEDLILKDLRTNINVRLMGPNIIKISYQSKDAAKTQEIVKTITDIFIEENVNQQSKEGDVAISFLEEELKVYSHKIKESEIVAMQDELSKLLIDSTENHPLVKELRQKIAKAQEEMKSTDVKPSLNLVENPKYEALRKELDKEISKIQTNITQEGSLEGTLADDKKVQNIENIYKLMMVDKIEGVLSRDIAVNEKIYNMLLERLETAKITQRLEKSKQGTRYTILDPPRYPLRPIKPNKFVTALIGLFLGGFIGFGGAFGLEFMDQSFLGIDEAKECLDLPILGAISKISTEEEISQAKKRKKMALTMSGAISLSLVFVLIIISLLRK